MSACETCLNWQDSILHRGFVYFRKKSEYGTSISLNHEDKIVL